MNCIIISQAGTLSLYDWDTPFEKQFSWVPDLAVHKAKMNKRYTTIHTNWNGMLAHTSSASSPKHDFLDETLHLETVNHLLQTSPFQRCFGSRSSLVPRLSSPCTTMTKSKEGETLVPFHMWYHRTNVTDISICKFRRHSCADRPFSYSVFLRVTSLGQLKWKERPGYAVDGACQFVGTKFHHRRVWNE